MLNFKDKRITLMGLGLHGGGVATARFLVKKGAQLNVTDLKNKEQLAPSLQKLKNLPIKFVLGRHQLADFRQADLIIQNPDVPRESKYLKEAVKNNIPIENEASLFFKLCPAPIIAVTGTRGKSTTTSLIYEILKRKNSKTLIAGNIRKVALLDIVDKIKPNTPVVLELSSWQLEVLERYKLSPQIGVLTNIMKDHLNRYKNFKQYIEAKKIIYKFQQPADFIIINRDNQITKILGKEVPSQRYWFSLKSFKQENGAYLKNNFLYFRQNGKEEKIINKNQILLPGEHNLANCLAAINVAKIYKVANKDIAQVLKNFKGLDDRLQLVREYQGIKYYNDTTATTPDACIAALKTLNPDAKTNIILLAGGNDKKLDYSDLAKEIKKRVKALIVFEGTATPKLVKALKQNKFDKSLIYVDTMKEAFRQAKYLLTKGDIFLLSPAAASFGLFLNEFDRGSQFVKEVKKIK